MKIFDMHTDIDAMGVFFINIIMIYIWSKI